MIKQRAKNWSLLILGGLVLSFTPACGGRLPASVPELPSAEEESEAGEAEEASTETAAAVSSAPLPQTLPQQMPQQQMMPQQMPVMQPRMAPPSVQVRPELYANPYLPNAQMQRMAAPGMPPRTPGVNGSYGPVPQPMPQYGYAQQSRAMMAQPMPGYSQQRRY
ncbi:MAG: hypothetical protein IGS03_09435 [Candidatus Sericytochromatia bacterium]|nr:hypothetical protein [Candidatus Sericytochromatia bacterium]